MHGKAARDRCDVVVVGAGAAGIAAANHLTAAGLDVVIVEARDRIGGRIHTLRPSGWPLPLEAGAEFIHGPAAEIWSVVRAGQLSAYAISESHLARNGDTLEPLAFDRIWSRVLGRLTTTADDEVSFAQFLSAHCADLSPAERAHVTAYVEGFNGADSRLISTRWLLESDRAAGQGAEVGTFRIHSGYDRVVERLRAGAACDLTTLRLGVKVSAIRWKPGAVQIEARSSTGSQLAPFTASRAVITLPLGVLRAKTVEFVPDLVDKWSASESLKVGSVSKLILRFREPFWESIGLADLGFLHAPEEPFPTWWTTSPMRSTILTAWAGGPASEKLCELSSRDRVDRALHSLSHLLRFDRTRLSELLEASHFFDWQQDPLTRGAYAYVGTGTSDAVARLAEPVDQTLFFAGEATDFNLCGTVAGAIASGYRVADEVLRSPSQGSASR